MRKRPLIALAATAAAFAAGTTYAVARDDTPDRPDRPTRIPPLPAFHHGAFGPLPAFHDGPVLAKELADELGIDVERVEQAFRNIKSRRIQEDIDAGLIPKQHGERLLECVRDENRCLQEPMLLPGRPRLPFPMRLRCGRKDECVGRVCEREGRRTRCRPLRPGDRLKGLPPLPRP